MLIKEFCAENLTRLPELTPKEFNRVELCDNLAVGGTTPSYGVIKEAATYLHEKGISLATMIRPRSGDFVYNDLELKAMEEDILQAVALESDYLVLGALTPKGELDLAALEQLLPATQGLPLVFHMAFDLIPKDKQKSSIDQLVSLGFVRILTHGGPASSPLSNHVNHIKELVDYANGRIDIMIGGGVTADNAYQIAEATGVTNVHGTKLL